MTGSETIGKPAQRPDENEPTTDDQDQDEETCPNGEQWCEGPESDGSVEIDETLTNREIRALTERLVVLNRDTPGLFTVFSEEGTEYTVDVQDGGACTCPDVEFNDPEGGCKHQHAARFLAGDRGFPRG